MSRAAALLLLACVAFGCAVAGTAFGPDSLEGTHWVLASLGPDRAPVAPTQTEPYLEFGSLPGRVTGSDGCNRLTCSYERNGDEIALGLVASTRMACERGAEVEAALGAALEAASKWAIVAGRLELYDAAGRLLASFSAGGPS